MRAFLLICCVFIFNGCGSVKPVANENTSKEMVSIAPSNNDRDQAINPESKDVNSKSKCVSALDDVIRLELKKRKPEDGSVLLGFSHVTFPKNESEASKLEEMAILALEVFAKEENRLPIEKAYFLSKDKKLDDKKGSALKILPMIVPSERVLRLPENFPYGKVTNAAFTFLPLEYIRMKGEVGVIMSNGDVSLPLFETPITKIPPFLKSKKKRPIKGMPNPELVTSILKNNYCF